MLWRVSWLVVGALALACAAPRGAPPAEPTTGTGAALPVRFPTPARVALPTPTALPARVADESTGPVAGSETASTVPVQVDPALVPGLRVLARLDEGRPLIAALVDGGIRIELARESMPYTWAYYEHARRVIVVDRALARADPQAQAALLAHEAVHVWGALDGTQAADERTLGSMAACHAEELRATLTELRVWQVLHGERGMSRPRHPYEVDLNVELSTYLRAPAIYPGRLAAQYAHSCDDAG